MINNDNASNGSNINDIIINVIILLKMTIND